MLMLMLHRRGEGKTALLVTLGVGAIAALGAGLVAIRLQSVVELGQLIDSSQGEAVVSPVLAASTRATRTPNAPAAVPLASTGPDVSEASAAAANQHARAGEASVVASCPGSLRLVGSIVNPRQPERSLAAIDVGSGTQLVRPGATVGEYQLIALRPRRAYLRAQDTAVCELHGVSARAPAVAAAAGRDVSQAPPSLSNEELNKGITQLDPRTFRVSRSLLRQVLADPKLLRRSGRVRVQPAQNGAAGGLAITRLPKRSPLLALGLKRGDVLRTVNGHDLSTPGGLADAMSALQRGERVSLRVARGSASETLTYIPN